MKTKFWKEGLDAIVVTPIMLIGLFMVFMAGIIIFWQTNVLWYFVALECLLVILSIYSLYHVFQRIIVSYDGIQLKLGKKQLAYIPWSNVTNVKVKLSGLRMFLVICDDNIKIDFFLHPKVFLTIKNICTNDYVQSFLDDSPFLRNLRNYVNRKNK